MPRTKNTHKIPLKALYDTDLVHTGAGPTAAKSGHEVIKVNFSESTGIEDHTGKSKIGFLKYCDETYPPLLAQMSVAMSHLYRLSLGDRAAEERLVYCKKTGKIIGTVSFAINDFVSLQATGDEQITDRKKERLANPSKELLVDYDFAAPLIASWRRKEDDMHPGNIGTGYITIEEKDPSSGKIETVLIRKACRLDYDMSEYQITNHIKGRRWACGVLIDLPHNSSKLLDEDLWHFPMIKGSRTYWPTRSPLHRYTPKTFKSQAGFCALADSHQFKEQMHFALLVELLSYQHSVIQERLTALIGSASLNLDNLGESTDRPGISKKERLLQTSQKSLFYREDGGERLVVDHLLHLEKQNYNEFYDMVVRSFPEFRQYLTEHPEAFQQAFDWFEAENNRINALPEHPSRAEELAYEQPYDLEGLELKYHQIWQDSTGRLTLTGLQKLKNAIDKLNAYILHQGNTRFHVVKGDEEDPLIISNAPRLVEKKASDIKADSDLQKAQSSLTNLYTILRTKAKALEDTASPTLETNQRFIMECADAISSAKKDIQVLYDIEALKAPIEKSLQEWDDILAKTNYKTHLDQRKQATTKMPAYSYQARALIPHPVHKSPITVATPNTSANLQKALITWLKMQDADVIQTTANRALEDYASRPGRMFTSWLYSDRTGDLKKILARKIHPLDLLKTVFGHGSGGWETTSYNTTLLKRLITKMVKEQRDVSFQSEHPIVRNIRDEISSGQIDWSPHIHHLSRTIVKELSTALLECSYTSHSK